jgi:arylsulfatase
LLISVGLLLGCTRAGSSTPELLLLISVDTLRADHLGAYGSDRGLTPVLDALARESVVFTSAYAPAPFTLPSMAASLTGRYPEELGISRNESRVPDAVPTLASVLREHGWRTAAVVSNFVLRDASGLAGGFDVYDDTFPSREQTRRWPERVGPATTDAALATLESCADGSGTPCFLWVHYQDPHGPYTPPPDRRERQLERERQRPGADRQLPVNEDHSGRGGIPKYQYLEGRRDVAFYRAGYAAEVAEADAAIGRLLEAVQRRFPPDRSIVVFLADHGEGLGEHDFWFAHGELLIEPLVRVPLMLRLPGTAPGRREDLASLVDLLPTLLARLLGPDAVPGLPGRDLLAEGAAEEGSSPYMATLAAGDLPHYALIEGDFKFVATLREGVWDGALYRRDDEGVDLAAAAPQIAADLRNKLKRMRADLSQRQETRQALSPEDVKRLEALGYAVEGED